MITKERAIELGSAWGQATLYHVSRTNKDGSAFSCRVNGKCRTWKRDTGRWLLPVKRGLRDCAYIGEGSGADCSPEEWTEVEPLHAKEIARMCKVVGLDISTPLPILADALTDGGHRWQAERLLAYLAEMGKVSA